MKLPEFFTSPDKESVRSWTPRKVRAGSYLLVLAFIGASALGIWEAGVAIRLHMLRTIESAGAQRLELYSGTLSNALATFSYLPDVLARDSDIQAVILNPANKNLISFANSKLKLTAEDSRAAAVYVMDDQGVALAASNFESAESFVGNNYAFRPYFTQASALGLGHFFGIGITSGNAGYFISRAIKIDGKFRGAVVVKIDLEPLQSNWESGGERLLVFDENKVAILSSDKDWKYRSEGRLDPALLAKLRSTQQYDTVELRDIDFKEAASPLPGSSTVEFRGKTYLMQSRNLANDGWTMRYFTDVAPVEVEWREVIILGCAVCSIFALLIMFWNQRRLRVDTERSAQRAVSEAWRNARGVLEREVEERTKDLRLEIAERSRVEVGLRAAQEELLHAGKMAVLGQMSAALAHEINQPLTAIQTVAASAGVLCENGDEAGVKSNLKVIGDLTMKMAKITQHLKTFSTKKAMKAERVALSNCITRAIDLLRSANEIKDVEIIQYIPQSAAVYGDEIRLEQVFINLIRNAIDAIKCSEIRSIVVSAEKHETEWSVKVTDTGIGIPNEHHARLFEPFFSTKNGEGLGLGLSLSLTIVRDFGGTICFENNPAGGSTFYVSLPLAHDINQGSQQEPQHVE